MTTTTMTMTSAAAAAAPVATPATCGRCGYSVIGLTSLTCPECGGDLRNVGILTPGNPDRAGGYFVAQALIFTLLYVATASSVIGLALELSPKPLDHARDTTLTGPASKRYQSVHVSTGASGVPELGVKTAGVRFELSPLAASPAAGAFPPALLIPPASDPSTISSATVLAWLKSCGVDVSDTKVQTEARTLAATARVLGRRQPVALSGGFGSTTSGTAPAGSGFDSITARENDSSTFHPAVLIGLGLLALAIWVCGLMLIRPRSATAREADGHAA